ncbi:hypothetical protein V6N13_088882 [Hibiscus sabdariffa]|uniref:Uncharacterized protein n=1 Tax=Hibiscus sabdariffa TaxID=183260 RepID=A0ABR2G165_9ROSI
MREINKQDGAYQCNRNISQKQINKTGRKVPFAAFEIKKCSGSEAPSGGSRKDTRRHQQRRYWKGQGGVRRLRKVAAFGGEAGGEACAGQTEASSIWLDLAVRLLVKIMAAGYSQNRWPIVSITHRLG